MTTLSQLAARARMKEMRPAGDQVFVVSDMEVDYAIATSDTGSGSSFRVERSSRGGAPVAMLSGTDRETAERYLAARLAADLRYAKGLPALRAASGEIAPGFEVAEDADGARLTWATGSAVFPGTASGRSEAALFSHIATAALDDIVARHGV